MHGAFDSSVRATLSLEGCGAIAPEKGREIEAEPRGTERSRKPCAAFDTTEGTACSALATGWRRRRAPRGSGFRRLPALVRCADEGVGVPP
ncbi:MAG TPA: hypothetical protein RMI62_17685, partial [Polyangiaceae bacterium LLY-WYZ-15_(1-7)]|nr:hypothetical protein [Polyangiaceae bacterium LLY-WYZ-15_(1-7)]